MINRRSVLQAGMVIAAAAASGVATTTRVARETQPDALLRYAAVAYDGRQRACAAFASEARRLGAHVHDIDGNITELWYRDLQWRWRQSPTPVAGMTGFSALLGLSMMASAAGLRVIFRANHHRSGSGYVHELFGPRAVLAGVARPEGPSGEWAAAAARIVMRWPAAATAIAAPDSDILAADRRAVGPDALVTWILAPRRSA